MMSDVIKVQQYKIIVSNRAKEEMGSHIAFLANINMNAAKKLKEELIKSIRSLTTMPTRYGFINDEYITPNKYHKMLVSSRYLLIYQIKDDTVYVEFIVDCRQNYQWLLH